MTPRPRSLAAASAALLAGCLVLVNLLAQRFPLRLDLSEGHLYSLSPGSMRVLAGLHDPVEVRVYFSDQLPPEYAATRSYVRDLLEEYRSASHGRLRVRYMDVDKDPQAAKEAVSEGVSPVQFNVISQEKYELRQGYMGLVLRHETQKEVIPVVLRPGGLEYELTSRLARLEGRKPPVIGFVTSDGAVPPEGLAAPVREALERRYTLRPLDLSSLAPGATVPADVSAVVMLGATQKLPDEALYALDQFLMSGRPLLVAADARRADLEQFIASPNPSGLRAFLARYGVTVGGDYVLDEENTSVQVTQQRGFMILTNIVPFPVFPVATDLDKDHPTTRYLDALPLPLCAPESVSSAVPHGAWTPLARSSPRSWQSAAWGRGLMHSISPMQPMSPAPGDPRGPFTLAGALSGPFRSAFASPGGLPLPKGAPAGALVAASRPGARLIVVGTSAFARADMPVGDGGPTFLLNAVDWLAQDTDLIAIRSKDVQERPLREASAGAKLLARWTCVLLPPLLVAALGLWRLRRRRLAAARRKAAYVPAAA